MGEAGDVAKAFVGEEKVKLDWQVPRENRPKQQVKLLLNMMLIAMGCDPARRHGEGGGGRWRICRASERAKGAQISRRPTQVLKGAGNARGNRCAAGPALLCQAACRGRRHAALLALDGADVVVRAIADVAKPMAATG